MKTIIDEKTSQIISDIAFEYEIQDKVHKDLNNMKRNFINTKVEEFVKGGMEKEWAKTLVKAMFDSGCFAL